MAKTIEDRAKEFAQISQNETWEQTRIRIWKQVSFEFGANSVLKEIEKLMKESESRCYREVCDDIKELIKELKGE